MDHESPDEHIRIRRGGPDDAEAVSRLLIELSREFVLGDFSDEGRRRFLDELAPQSMARRLSDGEYRFHLAEAGGALIGVAALRGAAHLYYLFVARAFQRRGLARRLWRWALEDGRAAGAAGRFTVNASLNAVEAYRRLGFVATGPRQERGGIPFVPMESEGRLPDA